MPPISLQAPRWLATGSNTQAIVTGLAGAARVIAAAAAIMIAVFSAFIPSTDIALKVIGIGIAAAILIDATVIRRTVRQQMADASATRLFHRRDDTWPGPTLKTQHPPPAKEPP